MLKWREADEKERIWVVDPSHPICDGLPEVIELEEAEMYGEHFDIPPPDTLVFISWFEGGEVFRSGCCYQRGARQDLLLPPGARDLSHLSHAGDTQGHRQRDKLGRARFPTRLCVRGNIPEFMK